MENGVIQSAYDDGQLTELYSIQEAENLFNRWKDDMMVEGVVEGESFVELVESENDFDDFKVIKKVVAVIDEDRMV
ncbi:hypothetical protein [Virgibacillus sp. L01]|uniref:hypothetical protein n=1 Tax=Virgibacillus sp. L01 TaxID=3457429 RepID=UPI003FD387A3